MISLRIIVLHDLLQHQSSRTSSLATCRYRADVTQQIQAAEKELPALFVILSPLSAPGHQSENL